MYVAPDASRPDDSQLAALCASLPESIDVSLLTSGRGVEVALSPLGTLPPLGSTRRAWPNDWTEPADLLKDQDGAADDDDDKDDDTALSRRHHLRTMAAEHGEREGAPKLAEAAAPAAAAAATGVGAASAPADASALVATAGFRGGGGSGGSPPSSGRSSPGGGSSSAGGGGMPLPPTGKVIVRGRPGTARGGAAGGSGGGSLSSRTDRRKRERAAQLEREVASLLARLMQLHDETSRIEEGNLQLLEKLMERNRNKAL